MKKLLFILLLVSQFASGQGSLTTVTTPNTYGAPGATQITYFLPSGYASKGFKLPMILTAGGAGEVGTTNSAGGSIGALVKSGTASMRFYDSVYARYTNFIVVEIYKRSDDGDGDFNAKYYKNAYSYMMNNFSAYIDSTQVYAAGLSLSGGAVFDLAVDTAFSKYFAAMASGDAVGGKTYQDNQANWLAALINGNLPYRDYHTMDDGNGGAATLRDKVRFYANGQAVSNPGKPGIISRKTGGHGGGWSMMSDTLVQTYTVDSSEFSGHGASVSYLHSPNVYNWFLSKQRTIAPAPPPTLPPDSQAHVYDIFMASYGVYDRNTPWNYFDAQKNGRYPAWDPKYGVTTDTTAGANAAHGFLTTNGAPRKNFSNQFISGNNAGTNYPGDRGARSVIDLTGFKDPTDTSKKFVVTDVYAVSNDDAGASTQLINFDKYVLRKSLSNRWQPIARPDSLCTPFATLTTTGVGGLIHLTVTDSMRYIMIVSHPGAGGHISQFSELAFYGHYTSTRIDSVRPAMYTGPLPSRKNSNYTYDKIIGTNIFSGVGIASTKYDGPLRLYTGIGYFDTATAQGIPVKYKYWIPGSGDFTAARINNYKANGHRVFITDQDGTAYNNANGQPKWPTDTVGKDPEQPGQYQRAADFYYSQGLVFGSNTTGTNKFSGTVANGQNLMSDIEIGNEESHHGATDIADYWLTSMARDGHNNLYGGGTYGLKNADPNLNLVMGGMVAPDTNRIKTWWFLSQILRADKKFPADVINFHQYFSNRDSLGGISFDLSDQIGQSSVPAEWAINANNGMLKFLDTIARRIYKYLPTTVPIWWTESGRSQWGTPAANETQAGQLWDIYNTPAITGRDSLQQKALLNNRQELLIPFSPVSVYNQYASANQIGGTDQHSTLFLSHGRYSDKAITGDFDYATYFPDANMRACIFKNLRGYYPDSIIRNGGRTGVWQVRYRKASSTDSTCNVIWLGSYNGSTLASQTIQTGATGSSRKFIPSYTDTIGTTSTQALTGGAFTTAVTEVPVMYFGSESGSTPSPPSCTSNTSPANGSTVTGTTTAALSWAANGATSYQVWINNNLVTTVGSNNYNAYNLPSSSLVTWYVVPVNDGGAATGCSSSATNFYTAVPPVTPSTLIWYKKR